MDLLARFKEKARAAGGVRILFPEGDDARIREAAAEMAVVNAADEATARREVEGGHEVVEFPLPAGVSTQKGLNEPRYPSLKGIMAAKRKPLEERDVTLDAPTIEFLRLDEPPAPAAGRIVGEGVDAVPELVRALRDEAGVL